jgi:starch synthase
MNARNAPIQVLFAAAEADPYVKVGGLGDVSGTLPPAIARYSEDQVDIRLVLPFHQPIRENNPGLVRLGDYQLVSGDHLETVEVWFDPESPTPVYFLDGDPVRATGGVYSTDIEKDAAKYIFFSLALLNLPDFLNWHMDVLHANDWHTAVSIYAIKTIPRFENLSVKTVLSVHNLPYLGEGCQPTLTSYGLPPIDEPLLPEWGRHLPLALGFAYADLIIPVSPGYAAEILTPEFGCGLEPLLIARKDRILGIVNGLNTDLWDPQTDPFLAENYDPVESLDAKAVNKAGLQSRFGFELKPGIPLMTLVTRLDRQKGVDIAVEALQQLDDVPWQTIILGSGDPQLQSKVDKLQTALPNKVAAVFGYENPLSHLLYAGADIFLMPSRYEPCGISQMIAMRYGTIPVAHATGGLIDTIQPTRNGKVGTGYLYSPNEPGQLAGAIHNAINDYRHKKNWHHMQQNAAAQEFSWKNSARQYIDAYINLLQHPS